jgi:hypothetical protein
MKILLIIFTQFYSTSAISYELRSLEGGERWIISSNEVDVFYGDLEAGVIFSVYEPGKGTLFQRRMEVTQKFIGFEKGISVRVGSYYTNMGRGILLNASQDETVLLDRFIDGILLEYERDIGGFKVLAGVPKNYLYYRLTDSTDVVAGGDFHLSPGSVINLGVGFLYLRRKDFLDRKRETYMTGFNMDLNLGNFDIYGEICGRKGWDPHFYRDTTGYAIFSGVNFSGEGYSLRVEVKDYKRFGHPYSLPPPLNHYGVYLNNARDERGYEIEGEISPLEDIYITLEHSKTSSLENGLLEEYFGSLKYIGDFVHFTLSADHVYFKNATGIGVPKRREFTPLGELTITFPYGFGIEVRYSKRKREELLLKYTDSDVLIGFSQFPYADIAYAYERRSGDIEETWKRLEIYFHLTDNFDIEIVIGSRRSDLVCSGGICRYEPEFDGLLLKLIYRGS